MLKLAQVKEQYVNRIYRCEEIIRSMNGEDLSGDLEMCKKELRELKEAEVLFANNTDLLEVFRINSMALDLLMEYSDIFPLKGEKGYKKHCLALLKNFKGLAYTLSKY